MKVSIIEGEGLEKEIIIKCSVIDDEILALLNKIKIKSTRLSVMDQQQRTKLVDHTHILYCEYIDRSVYVYTKKQLYTCAHSLAELEAQLLGANFIRCSKSMIVNIDEIETLQSEMSGCIIATLSNEERIRISRHYAKLLRQRLLK